MGMLKYRTMGVRLGYALWLMNHTRLNPTMHDSIMEMKSSVVDRKPGIYFPFLTHVNVSWKNQLNCLK